MIWGTAKSTLYIFTPLWTVVGWIYKCAFI